MGQRKDGTPQRTTAPGVLVVCRLCPLGPERPRAQGLQALGPEDPRALGPKAKTEFWIQAMGGFRLSAPKAT